MIDGHNLIPKIPGLSLGAIDDEQELVKLLQDFCRVRRQKVEVYFDNASPGQAGARKLGNIKVHFVRSGSTADTAIRRHLASLKRSAKNWTVVSSDRQVQMAAQAVHARSMSSEEFANLLCYSPEQSRDSLKDADVSLEPGEVEDWLKLFGAENSDK